MRITSMLPLVLFFSLWILSAQSKTVDPYKVLGVEQNASQREIQKAFHKLSLQYHPDKNKNKGAEAKFAEINNAYDILSDEEKRKIFDLYGDEKGSTGFDTGHHGDRNSYTHFTSGGPGHDRFSFNPDGWQNMGGSGGSKSFSFSFGGPGSRSFGFGLDDVFSNFFGGDSTGGGQFGGFTGSGPSGRSQSQSQSNSRSSSMMSIRPINRQVYTKEIADKGITWLLLSYTPTLKGTQNYESIIEEASSSLRGALKVGSINCESESSFCKELGIHPRRSPRLFVYSYQSSESGSFLEYTGDVAAKSLKMFCQEHLPRFSKRVNLSNFEFPSGSGESLPKVMLLSTKKDTPIIWRALSGLYRKSFIFYDTEVHDVSDPAVRRLGVDALPAIVGWLSNGEKHVLKTGITVKDLESAIRDLSQLLDGFEKKNNAARNQGKKTQIPLLMASNFNSVCGEKTPVCIIGAFRSSKAKEKLETILLSVSQKSLSRRQSKNSISYAVVDAAKQPLFLNSFDKSGFKSQDKLLIAYKPRKGTYSILAGDEINPEEVERFVGSVLNGDVRFSKTRQKPVLK